MAHKRSLPQHAVAGSGSVGAAKLLAAGSGLPDGTVGGGSGTFADGAAAAAKGQNGGGWSWRWLAEQLTLLLCVLLLTLLGQWALSLRFEQLAPEQQQQVTSSAAALERYLPVENGGESKRKLLWELAIRQYRGYSATEKLFGRGFGADALLYRISDDPRLLQAYPPQSREQLSAHNFLLTDLLNGGLVQMALGVCVWLLLAVYLIRKYSRWCRCTAAAFGWVCSGGSGLGWCCSTA